MRESRVMEASPLREISALVGGPGVDGDLNGFHEPTSTWHPAEATLRVEPTGVGAGLWRDPVPLAAGASRLGLDSVLLRLDWSRLEPSRGHFDRAAFSHSAEVIAAFRSAGLSVRVVLSGGELPAWAGPEAWLFPGAPEQFAAFAGEVVRYFGELVEGVVTFEAPAEWALAGWVSSMAPPFRRGAFLDSLAALDGMLSAHLLASDVVAERAPELERSLLSSPSHLGTLEALLCEPGSTELPGFLGEFVLGHAPGRAARLFESSAGSSAHWVVLGQGPSPLDGVLGPLSAVFGGRSALSVDEVIAACVAAPRGPVHLCLRSVVASIAPSGTRSMVRGTRRIQELETLLMGADRVREFGVELGAVVVGELVDRWRWGTYSAREGLIGVDRFRGDSGFRLQATDAAGNEISSLLR